MRSPLLPVGLRKDVGPVGLLLRPAPPVTTRQVGRTLVKAHVTRREVRVSPRTLAVKTYQTRTLLLAQSVERSLLVSQTKRIAAVEFSRRFVAVSQQVIKLKRNNNLVPIGFSLTEKTEGVTSAANLEGATAVLVYAIGSTVYRRTLTILSASEGKAQYLFTSADLATATKFRAEVEVTWLNGARLTYPHDDYIDFEIVRDLG